MTAPLSVQLYTLRDELARDLDGTLERLAANGLSEVEPFSFPARAAEIGAAMGRHGLRAPVVLGRLLTDGVEIDTVLEHAAAFGAEMIVDPYIAPERWQNADGVAIIADDLNALAGRAHAHGLSIGYHNHWWETEYRVRDISALEVLAEQLDPAVRFEVDIYWAQVGGVDPVGLLERLGPRVAALHVKDGRLGKDGAGQSALGTGEVPVARSLRAAPGARRVIELDAFDGDVWEPVEAGLAYLRKMEHE